MLTLNNLNNYSIHILTHQHLIAPSTTRLFYNLQTKLNNNIILSLLFTAIYINTRYLLTQKRHYTLFTYQLLKTI